MRLPISAPGAFTAPGILSLLLLLAILPAPTTQAAAPRKQRAPLVGINVDVNQESDRVSLSMNYIDAVHKAGGIPILLPPVLDRESVRRYATLCDGFVFTGGKDIDPTRYGETTSPLHNPLSPRRENFDFTLVQEVLRRGKPFLGICLGCQEINVALGGSLVQDIPTETSSPLKHQLKAEDPFHPLEVTTGSRLARILTTTTLEVNSRHHQSCDVLGRGLRLAARAPDGVVEAYEMSGRFGLGVQWHPEAMKNHAEQSRVFEALVRACRKKNPKQ